MLYDVFTNLYTNSFEVTYDQTKVMTEILNTKTKCNQTVVIS